LYYQASDKGPAGVRESKATLKPQGGGSAKQERVKAGAMQNKARKGGEKQRSGAEWTEPRGKENKSTGRNNSNLARTGGYGSRKVEGSVSKEAFLLCFYGFANG
jgi:hypothetical protein